MVASVRWWVEDRFSFENKNMDGVMWCVGVCCVFDPKHVRAKRSPHISDAVSDSFWMCPDSNDLDRIFKAPQHFVGFFFFALMALWSLTEWLLSSFGKQSRTYPPDECRSVHAAACTTLIL